MREIKFRVWENEPEKEGLSGIMINWDYVIISDYMNCLFNNDKPLMQFTGIKDKNGVDIYGGSIIQLPYVTPFGLLQYGEGERVVVKFNHGTFGFETDTEFEPLINFLEKEVGEYIPNSGNKVIYGNLMGEVIGNIYQHPELLE